MDRQLIKKYLNAGLSVFPGVLNPPKGESGLPSWGYTAKKQITIEEFDEMYEYIERKYGEVDMLGLSMYKLWGIDLDEKDCPGLVEEYLGCIKEDYPLLWDKLVIAKTKSDGAHIFFRGRTKIKRQFIIRNKETIAEGLLEGRHFARIAPTPGYEFIQGNITNPPLLTPSEVQALIEIAKGLSDVKAPPKKDSKPKRIKSDEELAWFKRLEDTYLEYCDGLMTFLEENADCKDIGDRKFAHDGEVYNVIEFHDPLGKSGRSGIIDESAQRVMVFSTSSKLWEANQRRADISGDKTYWLDIFDVYATYKTRGSLSQAVKEMCEEVGIAYGEDEIIDRLEFFSEYTGRGGVEEITEEIIEEQREEVAQLSLWGKSAIGPADDTEFKEFMAGFEVVNTARVWDPNHKVNFPIRMDFLVHEPSLNYYMYNPTPMLFEDSISYTTGAKKSGKTFNTAAIAASAIRGERVMGYKYYLGKGDVVWLDTEQEGYFFQKTQELVYAMAGITSKPTNYEAIHLRKYTHRQRVRAVASILKGYPNLKFLIIDGLVDLLGDFNDLKESSRLMNLVLNWCDAYGVNLHTLLHTNKGDGNIRGFIGSLLQDKATAGLKVGRIKGENCFSVGSHTHRGAPFPSFAYKRTGYAEYSLIEMPD